MELKPRESASISISMDFILSPSLFPHVRVCVSLYEWQEWELLFQ